MILVDTAVWVDHFRDDDPLLAGLLERGEVLAHPWVTGELALGHLRGRAEILRLLGHLPQATIATAAELLNLRLRVQILNQRFQAMRIPYVWCDGVRTEHRTRVCIEAHGNLPPIDAAQPYGFGSLL